MAVITIDVPSSADLTRAVDAMCAKYNYRAILPGGGANPEGKTAFAKRMVANWIKQVAAEYEAGLAAETARVAAETSANAMNIT